MIKIEKKEDCCGWEVIMVNDGSTDHADEIGKEYCEKDKRFRIYEQSNRGVSAARNKGIELCQGEYVFFMDADDTILHNTLSDLYDVISRAEADIVSFQYQKIQNLKDVVEQALPHEYEVLSREQAMRLFLQERLIGISMCTKLVKRSAIENIKFEVGRASNEDKDFLFNTLLSATRIVALQTKYYCYWTRENSATTRPFDKRWFDGYYFAKKIYIVNALLVFGMATFLGPVVQTLFHKDLTFSNRTNAWIAAFSGFLKNPIHGTGILTSESAKEVLGSLSYMQAHNEWLQCLWQGGIILFVIVTVMFLAVAKRINKIVDSKLKVVANLFLVSIFVEMAFEVWLGSQLTWIMLLMIYKMKCMESEKILSC